MPLLAALALAALLLMGTTSALMPGFDSEQWKAANGLDHWENPRHAMVSELEDQLVPGTTRADVLALLGEPEERRGDDFVYSIGANPYGIDYEYFIVEFDDDVVTGTHIERG